MESVEVNSEKHSSTNDESFFENPAFCDRMRDFPPSAKLVAKVLDTNAPLDQDQLIKETLLPSRTVRYALKQLEEARLITAEVYLKDARKQIYWLQIPE